MKRCRSPAEVAKDSLRDHTSYDIELAKGLVNDYIQLEKQFKGKITPFRSVVHFAAGRLMKPAAYETVLSTPQQELLKSVYYEYAP